MFWGASTSNRRFGLSLFSAPAEYPVTVPQIIAQVYGDSDMPQEQQDLITALIKTATEYAEKFRCERFVTQTWDYIFDSLPYGELELPYGPLQSITSIQYIDVAGAMQTLATNLYVVDTTSFQPKIYPAYAQIWPLVRDIQNAVTIRAVVGYGTVASNLIPPAVIHAIKLLVAHWFDQREPIADTNIIPRQIKMTVDALLTLEKKSFV